MCKIGSFCDQICGQEKNSRTTTLDNNDGTQWTAHECAGPLEFLPNEPMCSQKNSNTAVVKLAS